MRPSSETNSLGLFVRKTCSNLEAQLAKRDADLAACQEALAQCESDLAACQTSLEQCETDLGTCQTSLEQCETDLGACQDSLKDCEDSLELCQTAEGYVTITAWTLAGSTPVLAKLLQYVDGGNPYAVASAAYSSPPSATEITKISVSPIGTFSSPPYSLSLTVVEGIDTITNFAFIFEPNTEDYYPPAPVLVGTTSVFYATVTGSL